MSKVTSTLIIIGVMLAAVQPAPAQNYNPEQTGALAQVDITQGMAEQSVMHALRTGLVPVPAMNASPQYQGQQAPLQGYASSNLPQNQQQMIQNGQSCPQNFNNQNCNPNGQFNGGQAFGGSQGFNNGQNLNGSQFVNNAQGINNQGFNNQQVCNNGNFNQQTGNNTGGQCQNSGMGGLNTQMLGVMGAALLMNYATTGGAQNLMGELKARGFNNRFRTMGPCVGGGSIYH